MERRRAAGALLALAACILCTAAAPTTSNHTALDIYDGQPEGCYYNFQHYGEGDRIMTNEPCLNCTCHNRMLMCYLRVCPFTKPIGQDCTVEKRADQCCPIVTCPDVPVDLLTLTSTTSPAEYGATGVGKLDKYGCSINGKYFPEGSKVPPSPNKPCEHCYCIRNMTTCVMQECTLHVDGCTPIYHKDVCCPVRYSCDHLEDEIPLLDDKTTTVRPTPGFLLTTTTLSPVTQISQDCVHDDQIFPDGALIKTEKSCEHCYCMKGDIVCVVQDCGTPMENEGKNCTALPPREGQCCPDTYICEGDELSTEYTTELTTETLIEDLTTLSPPRRVGVEGSGYRKEPDNIPYTEQYPTDHDHEGSGDAHEAGQTLGVNDVYTTEENTKYAYTTVPSVAITHEGDMEQDNSQLSSDTTDANLEDHIRVTATQEKEQEITPADLNESEATTSSIPIYDHKLDTSQPEVQTETEKQSDMLFTTITPTQEEKKITTIQTYDENIGTDAVTIKHDKYIPTTVSPILEDEGITTESEREQQTIATGIDEDHSDEPELHAASTTSAPFLEEVEGTSSSTFGQHLVTDGITDGDIYDPSKNKANLVTTPAAEVTDNIVDEHQDTQKSTETVEQVTLLEHEYGPSTTNIPILDDFEKTTKEIPDDLTASKSSEETYDSDKLIPTSTIKSISKPSGEIITDNLKETSTSSESLTTASNLGESDGETDKAQTEKYDIVTDEKVDDINVDISTITSAPVLEQSDNLPSKTITESEIISSGSITTEASNRDTYDKSTIGAPNQEDLSITMSDKDAVEPQQPEKEGSTKPNFIEDNEKPTTQEIKYDITTDQIIEQQDYEGHKSTSTSAPITEEVEMTTTEFIRDQDYVTSGPSEQENLKPADYSTSTLSTPFLEEIEKLTTETPHGFVVTDIITEKEHSKLPEQGSTMSDTIPLVEAEITTSEPDKGLNTIPIGAAEEDDSHGTPDTENTTQSEEKYVTPSYEEIHTEEDVADLHTTLVNTQSDHSIIFDITTVSSPREEEKPNVEIEIHNQPEIATDSSPTTDLSELQETKLSSTESVDLQETRYPATESMILQEKYSSPQPTVTKGMEENIPSQEPDTEISSISSGILEDGMTEKEVTPEIAEAATSSTPIASSLPEVTTVNLLENEIDEENLLTPGRIPGEGDCLINGVTYRNETAVPSTNKCYSDCRCVSSIIKCNPIICSPPPEYMDNCQPTYDSPDSCCPSYVCDQFRETLPPMPHVHITTTELPQHTSIECRGDQCEIHEHKIKPDVATEPCVNNDCGTAIDDKTDSHTPITPESCSDGKCVTAAESCIDGSCKHPQVTDSSVVQCEGGKCEASPVTVPLAPVCRDGENCEEKKSPESIPTTCENGDDCKAAEESAVKDCAGETCRRKDTEDKPSSCIGLDCDTYIKVETSTPSGTSEVKTDTPKLPEDETFTTEKTIQETTVPERLATATEIGDSASTIYVQPTESIITTAQFDSQKVPDHTISQEESKLPVSAFTDKESITETQTEFNKVESTESHQIITEVPEIQIQDKQTFATEKPEDYAPTEPTKHVADVEENTIKIITDEEISTKHPTVTVELDAHDEHKKLTTEPPQQEQFSEVVTSQVTASEERTTLPNQSITEIEYHTDAPTYTKSEEITKQPSVETTEDTTTDYYSSGSKETTLTPSDSYVKATEMAEMVTDIQKGDDEKYVQSHASTTAPQSITSDTLPASTESSSVDVMITKSDVPITEDISIATDEVTEGNIVHLVTEKQTHGNEETVLGTTLPESIVTGMTDSTTVSSIKEHEVHTEHELDVSLPDGDTTSGVQKEKATTPQTFINLDDITVVTTPEQDMSESASQEPDKSEEEISVTKDVDLVTKEPSYFFDTTEKSNEVDNELTQTEKSQIPSHEMVTDISIEQVTMLDKATELPEILSHKKEHASESPLLENDEKTTIKSNEIGVSIQQEPSTEKSKIDTTDKDPEFEQIEDATEQSQMPITKDVTVGKEETLVTTAKPGLEHEKASTTDSYVSDLEKSTEEEQTGTSLPALPDTDKLTSVKQEITTETPTEKEAVTSSPDIISITDNGDNKVDIMDTSTDIVTHGYVSSVSYTTESEEPEITYTEKIKTDVSDATTKSFEAFTTEKIQEIADMQTTAPDIHEVVTEELPVNEISDKEENVTNIPVIQLPETTESKESEITTAIPDKYADQDLGTKIQDELVTKIPESVTVIPEIHSTLSSKFSESPETQNLVTEPQDTSKVPDEESEYQQPVTEHAESSTEQPKIEEPITHTDEKPSISVLQDVTKVPMTVEGHTGELERTTEFPAPNIFTDHYDADMPSAIPDVTEIKWMDVTQYPHEKTTAESLEPIGVTEQTDKLVTVPQLLEPSDATQHPHDRTAEPESLKPSDVTGHSHEKSTVSESIEVTQYPYERTTISETSESVDVTEHPHEMTTISESVDVTEHPHERTTISESSESISVTEHPHERTTLPGSSGTSEKITVQESSEPIDVTELPHEKTTILQSSEPTDVAEHSDEKTTIQESSSVKPEEFSTILPQDFTEIVGAVSSELLPERPIEATSQIPDLDKVEQEVAVTEAQEILIPEIKPSEESHTVNEEKATETIQGSEITTEAPSQPSESYSSSELPEPTSAPIPELSESTPYLIELQEHTHKTIQEELTTSQVVEESTTEKTIPINIEHLYPEPEIATQTILDQQTEMKEPTKNDDETSTPFETLEKTTQKTVSNHDVSLPPTQSGETEVKETTEYNEKDITTLSPTKLTEIEKESMPEKHVTDVEKTITTSEKPVQSEITEEVTTPGEIPLLSTEKTTTLKAEDLPTEAPAIDKITKPDEKPSDLPTPSPDLSKPGPSNIQPTDELPTPDEDGHFPPSGGTVYGNEPDYVEEDQAFGPGTCRYGGKVYVSAQQIPRDDPCDFCFCFRSDIICLQQSCPPPIHGCHEEPIQGFCCPRYECPVSMATTLNVTTTTTTTTTTLPPHFPTHSYKGAAQRRGCQIKGHTYKVGEVVRGSSGPCLHCTCGGDGQMKCDPKACTPEPMLRQMIAAAVSAKRRR